MSKLVVEGSLGDQIFRGALHTDMLRGKELVQMCGFVDYSISKFKHRETVDKLGVVM